MQCSICLYRAPEGAAGHKWRCCFPCTVQCRHHLPEQQPFCLSGPCLFVDCVHNQRCLHSHMIGHTAFTLKLTLRRWKMTSDGRAEHVTGHTLPPLDARDVVCPLMTSSFVRRRFADMHVVED